jgi:LacI family transcriptional regulator
MDRMAKKTGAVTIRDVSQLAGVSPATVSKVLNNSPEIASQTRERVLEAVQKLDFRPNSIARSLRVRRTLTLGLITDDVEGLFTTSMMRGVAEAASARGFSVFLCNSYGQATQEQKHLEVLIDKQVDGVILLSGYRVRERSAPALPINIPVLYLYQYTRDIAAPCVIPDDKGGAILGMEHLLSLGYRRIGFLNGPPRYEATHHRLDGYRQALAAAGLPFDPALVRVGTWHEESGYELANELLTLPERPDALFCAADSLAVGARDALRDHGLSIPHDLAVIGFDDRPFAAHMRPPLTTVALPLYEMGRLAGDLLVTAILDHPVEPKTHRVPCQLIVRQSTIPATERRTTKARN